MRRSLIVFMLFILGANVQGQNNPAGAKGTRLPPISAYLDENDDTISATQFQKIIRKGYYEMQIIQKQRGVIDLRLTPKPLMTLLNNPLPDFEFTDISGKKWNNKSIEGHMTVLHFWSAKSRPCLEELGWMNAFKRAKPDIFWLAPAIETADKLKQFLSSHKFDLVIIPAQKNLMEEFFVEQLPSDIIIDKFGMVREIVIGKDPEKIETFLDRNLSLK